MQIRYGLFFILLITYIPIGTAQESAFTIISLDGSARVQKSQERAWKKLETGDKLSDNDLVETYFQTKLILQVGVNNLIILGSNSKALLNSTESKRDARPITEISVTLFSGGIFSKAIADCRINIYTANAVGVIDSGSVTTVAEGKTGETGFQALGGMVYVRNIAQQKGIELRSGLTTMIQPGKEPTAPLYITHRHVAVLKHFFGDDYINSELDASGIKPTDERSGNRTGLSAFSTKSKGYSDEGMHRSLFNLSRIYGSILNEQQFNSSFHVPIAPPQSYVNGSGIVSFTTELGISSLGVSPIITPSASYLLGNLDAGIRLPFVSTATEGFSAGFSSLAGILDKIHHISYNEKSGAWSLFAGTIEKITFGHGLIVNEFTNTSHNNAFHPFGTTGQIRIFDELMVKAFSADISAPFVNGAYVLYEPSSYHIGAGYAGDFNQYASMLTASQMRYAALPESRSLFPDSGQSSVHTLLFDFTADIVNRYDLKLKLSLEFGRKLFDGLYGFVGRAPGFRCDLQKTSFGAAFVVESGKLLSEQFNASYLDHRYAIKSDLRNNFIDSIITPNNRLVNNRKTVGFSLFYKMNPIPGTDIDFSYKQDIISKGTVYEYTIDSTTILDIPADFNVTLKIAVNDSITKYLRIARITLQQSHGRLAPPRGLPFSSWNFNANLYVLSIPLIFNLAFETGIDFFYFDTGDERNYLIDDNDLFFVTKIGVHWGFK